MRLNVRKCTFWHVCPTKTQISLRIRAVLLESSLSAWRNIASLAIQNAPSEDSDQTARMRSLIWIFAGRTCSKVQFQTLWLKCIKCSKAYYYIIITSFWVICNNLISINRMQKAIQKSLNHVHIMKALIGLNIRSSDQDLLCQSV